ncbi:MAG: aminoglycoside phosphotransferase family protein [Planctomycetota bacterium]|nr:aminoglycoside phosphotransferase family protein [Planctomycetota bacterium]
MKWPPIRSFEGIAGHLHGGWVMTDEAGTRFLIKRSRHRAPSFLSKELSTLAWLREEGLQPVPKVLAYLEGDAGVEGFLVLEYIDAPNGDQWLKNQGQVEKEGFYRAMGKSLQALHQLSVNPEFFQPKDLSNIIEMGLRRAAPFLKKMEEINSYLQNELTRYPVQSPCFLHRDFRERNILVQTIKGQLKLTMLDFEWASVGDPFFDLAGSRLPFSKFSDSFIAGYTNDCGLSSDDWRKLRFYAVLDLLDVFTRQEELTVDISGLIYRLTKTLKKHLALLRESS